MPPFASRTRPVAVLFRASTTGGDVVTLRIPGPDDPSGCADGLDGPDPLGAGPTFGDQMPTWWVEQAVCERGGGCACGLTELSTVADRLDPADQRAALDAHLAQLQALQAHLEALFDLTDGTFGDVCAVCVADPGEHAADLDATIDAFARDLVEAVSLTGLRLQVEG